MLILLVDDVGTEQIAAYGEGEDPISMPVLDTLAESIGHIGTSTLELRATAAATAAESSSRIDSLSEGMGNQLRFALSLQEAYEIRFSELQGHLDSMTQSLDTLRDSF